MKVLKRADGARLDADAESRVPALRPRRRPGVRGLPLCGVPVLLLLISPHFPGPRLDIKALPWWFEICIPPCCPVGVILPALHHYQYCLS